jgi:cytochrome c peroxidase
MIPSRTFLTGLLPALFLFIFISSFRRGNDEKSEKISLGRQLFFDPILSSDSSVSCGSCHKPELYFADSVAFSRGVGKGRARRNTPSVLNMASREFMFWDGRAVSLEHQTLFPVQDPNEMNLPVSEAVRRLRASEMYQVLFQKIYGKPADEPALREVLAAFESSLETSGSRFDLAMNGKGNLTFDEKAGQKIFVGKGKCFDCHFGQDFTGDEFRNIGLYDGKKWIDAGRFEVTKDSADIGKFKVPGLRNVAMTAPYMHNGSFRTLREVIDFYVEPQKFVASAIGTDSLVKGGISLNEKEKQQLEAFMKTLTSPPLLMK